MTEMFIIISSKKRRPVLSKFKEKLIGHCRDSKIQSPPNISQLLARKIVIMKTLYEEHSRKTFKAFVNNSYGDRKIRCSESDQALSTCPAAFYQLISLFSKSSWIKPIASRLCYELGVNVEKKLMKTGILLINLDIAHFTLVNLGILTV